MIVRMIIIRVDKTIHKIILNGTKRYPNKNAKIFIAEDTIIIANTIKCDDFNKFFLFMGLPIFPAKSIA